MPAGQSRFAARGTRIPPVVRLNNGVTGCPATLSVQPGCEYGGHVEPVRYLRFILQGRRARQADAVIPESLEIRMAMLAERRNQNRSLLNELNRRTWHLWGLSLFVTVTLAVGFVAFSYPAVTVGVSRLLNLYAIPLLLGLFVLVLLTSLYIIAKQRELKELRDFILSTYGELRRTEEGYLTDALTGVLDRHNLPDILKLEGLRADRYRGSLCLTLFDIRDFSKINEKEGHLAGDLMLRDLAKVLQMIGRKTDIFVRYGPDEFLCFLPATELPGARVFAQRVRQACDRSPRLRNVILNLGFAEYRAGRDLDETLSTVEDDLKKNAAEGASASEPGAPSALSAKSPEQS